MLFRPSVDILNPILGNANDTQVDALDNESNLFEQCKGD